MEKIQGTPDCYIVKNFISDMPSDDIIKSLNSEIEWNDLISYGHTNIAKERVGVFQGKVNDEYTPWLRCPSINNQEVKQFTPTVSMILQKICDYFPNDNTNKLNICKIQCYKNNTSSIQPHSDKIIDLENDIPIYNLRFGQTRIFRLINKLDVNNIIDIEMSNNTLLILGLKTNNEFTHSVPVLSSNKHDTPSYSLIYRASVTFKLNLEEGYLFGPRTMFKTKEELDDKIKSNSLPNRPPQNDLAPLFRIENTQHITLNGLYGDFINKSF